ncbi:MAG: site-specific integrase [Oceanospirillales bacterium]|nr:site-specific integrase [Oceanospirillales bacterium]
MSALRDFISAHTELRARDEGRKLNRFIDATWFWVFHRQSATEEFSLNFQEIFGDLAPHQLVFAKQVLMPNSLKRGSHERVLADGRFTSTHSAITEKVRILQWIFRWQCEHAQGDQLSDMTASQVEAMFAVYLRTEITRLQMYPGLRAYSQLDRCVDILKGWQLAFQMGEMADGISVPLSKPAILETLVKLEAPHIVRDFDYARWKKGKKHDGLGVPQQIALLMHSLEFLRSDKTKLVIALTRFSHQGYLLSNLNLFRVGGITRIGTKGSRGKHKPAPQYADKRACLLKELSVKFGGEQWEDLPDWLGSFSFEAGSGVGTTSEFSRHQNDITTAALIVFMILSGARRNELESIQGSDIEPDLDGTTWTFRSDINKTNQGIGAIRYIGGIVAEVTNVLRDLKGYVDPEFQEPLFKVVMQKLDVSHRPNRAGKTNIRESSAGVQSFINRHVNPFLHESLKITDFTPHSCRHAWAEFALRRFDGNSVPELIREHFRHAYGSYMTDHYIMGKVFEEDGRDLQMEYIRELIGRVAEGSERIYGPVGDYIITMIESFEFVHEDEIELIADTFEGYIDVHEYGFCLVRPETVSQAQCFNKETQLAETTEACWEKCGGCLNRGTMPSQREDIHRLGVSAKVSINSFKNLGLISLVNVYESQLKRCAAAINEIDSGETAHV